MNNKKGQVVLIGLFKVFVLIVLGIFLMNIYPPFRDMAFAATENLFIRLPVMAMPFFYFIGVLFVFVRTIRGQT